MVARAPGPEYRNVDAFLDAITGCDSGGGFRVHRNAGTFRTHSDVPERSETGTGTSSQAATTVCDLIPVFRSEGSGDTIGTLLDELADDIDDAAASGGRLPFTGDALRQHYRQVLRDNGADDVLQELRHRRAEQVACRLLPLVFPATGQGYPA